MIRGLDKRLQLSRVNSNLTRKQVAELINVSESLIGLYESGSRQPSLSALIKLASVYKVSTDYLLNCEMPDVNQISVAGLNEKQIQALKLTIQCFRKQDI